MTGEEAGALERVYAEWDGALDYGTEEARLLAALAAAAPPRAREQRRRVALLVAAGIAVVAAVAWLQQRQRDTAAQQPAVQQPAAQEPAAQESALDRAQGVSFRHRDCYGQELRLWLATGLGRREDRCEHGLPVATTLMDPEGWATFVDHTAETFTKQLNPGDGTRNFHLTLHDPPVFLPVVRHLVACSVPAGSAEHRVCPPGALRAAALPHLPRLPASAWRGTAVEIWLDERGLPERLICTTPDGPGERTDVYDEFAWGRPDAQHFAPPAGYRGRVERLPVPPAPARSGGAASGGDR